jgi:hypothetical protein
VAPIVPEESRISCPGVKLDAPGDVVLVLVGLFISYAGVCVDAPEFPPALPSPRPVEPAYAPMMPSFSFFMQLSQPHSLSVTPRHDHPLQPQPGREGADPPPLHLTSALASALFSYYEPTLIYAQEKSNFGTTDKRFNCGGSL